MSNRGKDRKWYERVGVVTIMGVIVGVVIGLARNDLIFGVVMGFFLGLGVPLGALGARFFGSRIGETNMWIGALIYALVVGIAVSILSAAISGILDSVKELVTAVLEIALNSGSDIAWGIAIGIGTAVGAVLRGMSANKDRRYRPHHGRPAQAKADNRGCDATPSPLKRQLTITRNQHVRMSIVFYSTIR